MPKRGTRLTGRGIMLLVLGVAATAGAGYLGERDLMWVALTLAVLPLLAAGYLVLARPRVSHQRSLTPPTIPVGTSTRVVLQVANQSPAQASALRFLDTAPDPLGGGAAFVIARGFGRWRQAVGYTLEAALRGRFEIGPLLGSAADPFGLALRTFTAAGETTLLRVTPRVWPLGELTGGAGLGAAGDATPQRIGQAGQDDVLVREHRHGDDMRRVHWKMSAKQGDLMVRLEEHPWDPSSTLIVDNRLDAHLGEGPTGSLEWAVSAVTSIAALLVEGRYRLSVVAPSGTVFESGHAVGHGARHAMVEAMTDLAPSEETWLGRAVTDTEALTSASSIVAATGLLRAADAAALVAAGGRARSLVALVPDARAWGAADDEHDDACRLLRNHGWTIEAYAPGEPMPQVWKRVSR
ncbi:DUF58 domain-containing protein [Tessaracoccus sp. MC1679]|uniref:DUF58 domain-containing protein n=1 Tax=unclassified Tessaracoccus TaxID=2635419 RepID=UPI0015FEFC92|nr:MULTISPECIES: DUF58 domain-containing protein [unclassified Tessaracoccus]MBB1512626.1 DUF58 domain-containing protein [Tessaracoccus sp. MC1627]MBB1516493.1 DUF58 domain-containing protein [Tessaracoccus sp. MC1679]